MPANLPRAISRPAVAPLAIDPHWAGLAIVVAFAAYGASAAVGLWSDPGNLPARLEEFGVLAVAAIAWPLSRKRPQLALLLVLGATWCQLFLSIAQWGYYGGGALVALPVVIVAAGMAFGVRGAVAAAASSCVVLPVAYFAPWPLLRGGMRFDIASHGHVLIAAEASFVATAFLVRAIIVSYRAALEKSDRARKRYGELFALAPDGLLELDENSVVRDVNAAALHLFGQERADVIGESLAWLLRSSGTNTQVHLEAVRPGVPFEVVIRPGSASSRSIEIAVQQRLGVEARTLLILRDVTARRQLEERLAHTQRMETVGRLAGGVAHDFNNLLTAIGGNAGLLIDYPDPSVREMAADIQEAHRRGATLTRQLLAFARRDVRRPEVLEISAAVRDMNRLLERVLGEQHRLALHLDAACRALADRGQIEQVLLNLVSNARDAMPDGGTVAVTCAELDREPALELGSALVAERQVMLAVTDNGIGMTPEVQARLFEPFFTTKPRGRGTGLGLSIVHGIVLQNEGAIHIESAPGRGTTVRVFLPTCAVASPAAAGAAPKPEFVLAGGEHVLLVEDEIAVRRFVERALVDGGYRVTNANDSMSALAIFAAAQPPIDLVLTDIVMPGMSGLELAKKLAEQPRKVPVLFMSGHFEASTGDQELDPGGNLLVKPFGADELLRRMRERLRVTATSDGRP
ncbi:MAG TPA: ATP-binding protein [Opitutaceae bacterium]|nr:ATP-binding protein [Opitutaceae bacterium]